MLCIDPKIINGDSFPCGKCESCCINHRRTWELRCHLESSQHDPENAAFVTVTYDNANLPYTEDLLPTLRKKDLQDLFKRVRNEGIKFRYLAVGEYGTKGGRPHYHAIIWGPHYTVTREYFEAKWKNGWTMTLPVTDGAIGYVGKYIYKSHEHLVRNNAELKTQAPFKLSSRRPPIGLAGLKSLGEQYKTYPLYHQVENTGDIERMLKTNGKYYYLRTREATIVREAAGVPTKKEDRFPIETEKHTDEQIEETKTRIRQYNAFKRSKATF